METYRAQPNASALIESMRDLGYSLETALADIVDNSITAKASLIQIHCGNFAENPVIAVVDNGTGMSKTELLDAMRPGSMSPLDLRDINDLGRFGLGLKTASFSQCRKLTVITRKEKITSCAKWDLDFVAETNDWLLQIPTAEEVLKLPFVERLGEKGTVVIWEQLDRLSDFTDKTSMMSHIYERLESAQKHLELIFHRFLSNERSFRNVAISINDHPLEPFDPYHSSHPATQQLPTEPIKIGNAIVKVKAFVLPHHQKVTASEWEKYGGEDGYLKGQGFYIYRVGRLIIHGSWFRLAKKSELTKLARVQVDMPNELDNLWKIDIKKASAVPPLIVRERLRSVIDLITGTSSRTYKQRGAISTDPRIIPIWNRKVSAERFFYELNRDHPSISQLFETIDTEQSKALELLLKSIENSFPIDTIFADIGSNPTGFDGQQMAKEDLLAIAAVSINIWRQQGFDDKKILANLKSLDPVRGYWEELESTITKLLEENS